MRIVIYTTLCFTTLGLLECGGTGGDDDTPIEPTPTQVPNPGTNTPDATAIQGEDLYMNADDFECILNGDAKVGNFYVTNKLGHSQEALAVAQNPAGGTYPVGTIIQMVPTEAMVKRYQGWSPETHDWEYFLLSVDKDGTTITQRGDSELGPTGVTNTLGTCHSCHVAAQQWDLVCETTHGCPPLPFTPSQITNVQEHDPRCQ